MTISVPAGVYGSPYRRITGMAWSTMAPFTYGDFSVSCTHPRVNGGNHFFWLDHDVLTLDNHTDWTGTSGLQVYFHLGEDYAFNPSMTTGAKAQVCGTLGNAINGYFSNTTRFPSAGRAARVTVIDSQTVQIDCTPATKVSYSGSAITEPSILAPSTFVSLDLSGYRIFYDVATSSYDHFLAVTGSPITGHRGGGMLFYLGAFATDVANYQKDEWLDGVYTLEVVTTGVELKTSTLIESRADGYVDSNIAMLADPTGQSVEIRVENYTIATVTATGTRADFAQLVADTLNDARDNGLIWLFHTNATVDGDSVILASYAGWDPTIFLWGMPHSKTTETTNIQSRLLASLANISLVITGPAGSYSVNGPGMWSPPQWGNQIGETYVSGSPQYYKDRAFRSPDSVYEGEGASFDTVHFASDDYLSYIGELAFTDISRSVWTGSNIASGG